MPLLGNKIKVSTDNFANMVRGGYLLVDKTLMIKDVLEDPDDALILRPRRFGKTLNMSMLQHFFAAEVGGQSTSGLFDAFAIAREESGRWMQHQGRYPVIFISFKDVKEISYTETVSSIHTLVAKLYREHQKLLLCDRIGASDKALFQRYVDSSANDRELQQSISFLSEFLFKASGKKAVVLIDEYDTPLTHAYQHHFIEEISLFMRNMFSAALKGNIYLEKGLMTGILRVSKNELLSGLNNLKIYGVFDDSYSQYFGFTEEEVAELTERIRTEDSVEVIKQFYKGYLIGDKVIYNPWSFMNYLGEKQLAPYWVWTSGDHLLRKLFLQADPHTKEQLSKLMKNEVITGKISLKTSYEDLMESPDALWTLLLFSGYLTASNKTEYNDALRCDLRVPNKEILAQYNGIFTQRLTKTPIIKPFSKTPTRSYSAMIPTQNTVFFRAPLAIERKTVPSLLKQVFRFV